MSYLHEAASYAPGEPTKRGWQGDEDIKKKPPPPVPPKHSGDRSFRAEDEPLDEMHRPYHMRPEQEGRYTNGSGSVYSPRNTATNGGNSSFQTGPQSPGFADSPNRSISSMPPVPPPMDDVYADETLYFERSRIKQLQDERVHIQKKTFTKWCNSFLNRARLEVVDLFSDLSDGVLLMKLLEIISGDKLGKPNRGKMRVQKIENLNKSIDFLKRKKIQLENIGAEDILDRNERLILGLIWTIILRFQIDTIVIDVGEEETGERKNAKDALLLWCQRKTAGYAGVKIDNFTTSWRSGLAFNALIHAHRPDLIHYDGLAPADHIGNLNNAFDVAERKLEIARLLDAEDVDTQRPDEKSIITYVSLYYHYFAKQKTEMTGARRVANIMSKIMSADASEDDYETISSDLLDWIRDAIKGLSSRNFPNSLHGIQEQLIIFNQFRNADKPLKYKEKGELEALFFTIQTKRKAMSRKAYVPPQGKFMHDIESAWVALERAESERQTALTEELLRQQRLERLAERFLKKAQLRESWLRDMGRVVEQLELPRTAGEVDATLKKHHGISADVLPREERFKVLSEMCADLCRENYHESDKIRSREREIIERWTSLLAHLEEKRLALEALNNLMTLLRDLDALSTELQQLETLVRNRDVGKHMLGVEDLLQKHELLETQIHGHGTWLAQMTREASAFLRSRGEQAEVLQRRLEDVSAQYQSLVELCAARRAALQRARELFQFVQDDEEERAWLAEKQQVCQRALESSDISHVPQIQRLFKNVETEMQSHWTRSKEIIAAGERLIAQGHPRDDIVLRTSAIQSAWDSLRGVMKKLGQWLADAQHAQQYFQDANEAESWMREKMPLVRSDDLGKDEFAAERLLLRHTRLEEEIHAYRADIVRLEELANQLATSHFHSASTDSSVVVDEDVHEMQVPTIKMLYKFENETFSLKKDETLALLDKSTPDWWKVVRQDGTEGYVPANYVKEEPDNMITVTTTRTRKKTAKKSANVDGRHAIVERQKIISADYRALNRLADERRRLLSDNIKLMRFYRECDEFETWTKDTERALVEEPTVENVEEFRKRFERLENDIRTNGGTQLKCINDMAEELLTEGHSQSRQIESRQRAINAAWAHLEKLRAQKAARLATVERVAEFDSACDDARSWMKTKFDMIERDPNDLKSLQNLERDLKPLEDRIKQLEKMANDVRAAHPEQAAAITAKMAELAKLHQSLLRMAEERIQMAEQTQGQSMFDSALRDMHAWIEKTKKDLSEDVRPVDVAEAEELLKKHFDLGETIKDKKYEVEYVNDLGRRLLEKNPRLAVVKESLAGLDREMNVIRSLWKDRDIFLQQHLDLQIFNREAERIDAASKGHEAFLDYADLGDSVESVENLMKRHKDLEAKLDAQESRLTAFSRNADELIKQRHAESPYIEQRRREVIERRAAVRRACAERKKRLDASLEYQSLKRDGQEMLAWIAEKKKVASDDSHRDLASIDVKLLKHEAFEAEIKANAPRVEQINKEGALLVSTRHYEAPAVGKLVESVNTEWAELRDAAARKGERLRQAAEQKGLNRVLDDAHTKLDELENVLRSQEYGSDLRGVKELIQKHVVFEQELSLHEKRLKDIAKKGEGMAAAGHFDADRIQRTVRQLLSRFEALKEPTRQRRIALDESMQWHQLAFDVDCELQWIAEKEPIAASEDTGRTLTEATAMLRKHEQLEAELAQHVDSIEKTIGRGNDLIAKKHPAKEAIHAKCDELNTAWSNLSSLIRRRKQIVDWGIREQQYLADANEVESWMTEKKPLIESDDYGQDEDAAQKLLTKHKALMNDMHTYKKWLEKLAGKCGELVTARRPHSDRFEKRQTELEREFERLSGKAEERRRALEDALCLYEYLRESADLEQWINNQLQAAMSEEYGEDYDHLKELQIKFEEFKQTVKTGTERFRSCEAAANSILRRNPPFAKDILKRQEKLRSVWTLLVDYIESREAKLRAAEELHRFNRDVSEHEESVAGKLHSIPNDTGRDVKQVHSLWQKHEAFEKQVISLEESMQSLLTESARLKEIYPGGNAEHIGAQQAALTESWQYLREATDDRKQKLKAAYDLHRFVGEVRDLLNWADMKVTEMQSEQNTHDLQGAEFLQKEHQTLHVEIEGRQAEFAALIQKGERMIAADHYAEGETRSRCAQLEEALARLRSEWQLRNSYLAQVVQWHDFQRDAKQILAAIHSKRATLRSSLIGSTVHDVESATRRLDTFEKAIQSIRERVAECDRKAVALVEGRHMEKEKIEGLQRKVHADLSSLSSEIDGRRLDLVDALTLVSLQSDIVETEAWIEDRMKAIKAETERQGQCTSIEDKMKRLQKHQAFEAELESNKPRVHKILHTGRAVRDKRGTEQIAKACDTLSGHWYQLEAACADQSRALEEARDLLAFTQLVVRVMEWVREKEMMVSAADMGNDLEHCRLLIERLDGTKADSSVDEQTIEKLNRLGEKLIHQGRGSRKEVQAELQLVNETWRSLHGKVDEYRQQLHAAREVHQYTLDVDDTNERIHEKTAAMRSDEFGRDFASVDALVRKQKALERDMGVIHQKLIQHDTDAQLLLSKKPPLRERILSALKKLEESWNQLSTAAEARNLSLDRSYKLHKYLDSVKRAEEWANILRHKISAHSPAKTAAEARALLEHHNERKAEMDAREEELKALHEEGVRLIAEQPDHKGEIQKANRRVQNSEHQLRQTWESERGALIRLLEFQLFCEQAAQVEAWLTAKEEQVHKGEMGEKPDEVTSLINKHETFEHTLHAQSDKLAALVAEGEKLVAQPGGEYAAAVEDRMEAVKSRHARLLEHCERRRALLADSLRFAVFLRSCGELIAWISSMDDVVVEDPHDSTSLRSKLQEHLAIDSELNENEKRLFGVMSEGAELIKQNHYNKDKVEAQLSELRAGWEELRKRAGNKTNRLRCFYECYLLERKMNELEKWMDGIEGELASANHGTDMNTVDELLRKLESIDAEIKGRHEGVEELMKKIRDVRGKETPEVSALVFKAAGLEERYKKLAEPVHIRGENLREWRKMYEWKALATEELQWLRNRLPEATSTDVGESLAAAQSLMEEHTALESELESRQSAIREVEARGTDMMRARHHRSDEIQKTMDDLTTSLLQMRGGMEERRRRLEDAIQAHEYYTGVGKAEKWIKTRMVLASNQETGKDAAAVVQQERTLAILDKDVEKFRDELDRLAKIAERLTAGGHRDSTQISGRQSRLSSSYSDLVRECNKRRQLLINAMTYHDFVKKADTLAEWLHAKAKAASSEEYGRDLEECQTLIDEFETVIRELAANGERVAAVQRSCDEQLRANHPYSASIRAKGEDLQRLWHAVNEDANERQQALAGARQVHKFDQEVDETIHWLNKKERMGTALEQEDLAKTDLEGVKRLIQKQDEFVHGMKAVEKQVRELCTDAERLAVLYPQTRSHLEIRRLDMEEQLKDILESMDKHYSKLREAELLQAYFQEHRELMAWIRRVQELITSESLAMDVPSAEALMSRHAEYATEMKARSSHVDKFVQRGKHMMQAGHVLSAEVNEKVESLQRAFALLGEIWAERHAIYEANLDVRKWQANATQLESWMIERESMLGEDWRLIESVDEAETKLREFDDFLVTLDAQGEKRELVKRLTLIETKFANIKKKEVERIKVEDDATKKREEVIKVARNTIIANRRIERERRKTQEISLLKPAPDEIVSQTLPRKMDKRERSKTTAFGDASVAAALSSASPTPLVVETAAEASGTLSRTTPAFTTRRQTSMRKTQWEDSTIDMRGFVDRKHQLQGGGLKATVRSWKNHYAILCGQLLCFFKDEHAFLDNSASTGPLNIYGALCKEDKEYLKRKHTFRLRTSDGSEFLFSCASDDEMQQWLNRIQYHAGLAPRDQLRSFSNSVTSNGSGGAVASSSSSEYRPHASSYERGATDTSAPVVPSHRPPPSFATIDTTPVRGASDSLSRRTSGLRREEDDRRSPATSFSNNGGPVYRTEVRELEYREATSVSYQKEDCSVHRNSSPSFSEGGMPSAPSMPRKSVAEGGEFIAWVEKYGGTSQQNLSMGGNSSADDNDSIKSGKKKGIGSFFKRNPSKASK
ncbi:hypothetical protein PENTCL1PPCAC_1161 [Pristionchus entomophagus]|uniref:Uncharacterized protein n=1 Tax=Pristionchus entomophagus TaxID=358040 RepID=A0AAV5S7Q4_9BILA|nr:hypothetical protein PENTCL1PPCAC_1161 [Pristionchus entomophagus]